jgi:sigma-B regulation protein RsbU (phosphoserine phosphatase)
MSKILIIDDEQAILENLKFVLELDNYDVISASSGEEGIQLFKENIDSLDTVVTDMRMPKCSGMDVLKEVKSLMPEMSIIVLTGHGDMENAISAMKEGAFEYLLKPVNVDMLSIALRNAINRKILQVNNNRLEKELLNKNKFLQNIHDSAQKILLNMLPEKFPNVKGFKFDSKYNACDVVGGDMYDIIDTEKYLCFYVFDVSSHGILASVITIILKSFIQNIKYTYTGKISSNTFKKIIFELNNILHLNTSQEVFATLFMGLIDKNSKKLQYISAGHIKQYLFNKSKLISLESTGTILGVFEDSNFDCIDYQLNKNDKILLFTDGVTEASKDDDFFGEERLQKLIDINKSKNINENITIISNEINSFSEKEQSDDITMLGIELI